MTTKECQDQKARIAQFESLTAKYKLLDEAQTILNTKFFTGNASQVQRVEEIQIRAVGGETVVIPLTAIDAWEIKNKLEPLIMEKKQTIHKLKENL